MEDRKGVRQRAREKKLLWLFRVARKRTPAERKAYVKYARKMQRYAARGQLRNGQFFCKFGLPITPERLARYNAACHAVVRSRVPARALWEAASSYEDLVNQSKLEVFLTLLNGFDPAKVLINRKRTSAQLDQEVLKLEQTMVFGRLRGYFRRQLYNNHPDQLGGRTISQEQFTSFAELRPDPLLPVDFVSKHKDNLLRILDRSGPEAAKKAFFELDFRSRDILSDWLVESKERSWNEYELENEMLHGRGL